MQQTMYPAVVNSPQTELAADISADAVEIQIANIEDMPAAPNLATIGNDETAETVLYTGTIGSSLTGVTRGFQGTAKSWSAGTRIARYFTAYDHEAFRANIKDLVTRMGNAEDGIDEKLSASTYTAADVLAKLLTVDGTGSGLDADKYGGVSKLNYDRLMSQGGMC